MKTEGNLVKHCEGQERKHGLAGFFRPKLVCIFSDKRCTYANKHDCPDYQNYIDGNHTIQDKDKEKYKRQ